MGILHDYSRYLAEGNAAGMAALFAPNGEFRDEAPVKIGLGPIAVDGREAIGKFYQRTFKGGGLKVNNVGICQNAMRYDVTVGDVTILCLGVVEEENGLIRRYRVIAV